MSPTLRDGDFVLVVASRLLPPRAGTIALVAHGSLGTVLKRVARRANGRGELRGDSPLSMAPEHLGTVPEHALLGRACLRVSERGVHWLGARR